MKITKQYLKDIKTIISYSISFKKYSNKRKKENKPRYILFGTPKHGNIGDQAITIAEYKILKDQGIEEVFEVSSFTRHYIIEKIKKLINLRDVILINGGGFMGSQWMNEEKMIRDVVSSFPNNKIIIFPQTIFYKTDSNGQEEFEVSFNIYNSHKNLVICTREKISYEFAVKTYTNAKVILVPDIVLYLDSYDKLNKGNREDILLCLRSDPEGKLSKEDKLTIEETCKKYSLNIKYTDTVVRRRIEKEERHEVFIEKITEFANAKFIVTDRLHGMIFALLTKTPCVVLSNYNHKIKGVYEWFKEVEYITFLDDIENLEESIVTLMANKKFEINSLKDDFQKLINEIK